MATEAILGIPAVLPFLLAVFALVIRPFPEALPAEFLAAIFANVVFSTAIACGALILFFQRT